MAAAEYSDHARSGFADGASYDQYRPSFPEESVNTLLEAVRVSGVPGAHVVDLGAGTGKFTELLAQRHEDFRITAVEPHEGMRQVLEAKQLKNVHVENGISNKIPVKDQSVDAVIVAQAFHWFANDESLREFHRVIKPHGCLGLIWNIEDYNAARSHAAATAWEAELQNLTWSFDDGSSRYRHEKWKEVFDKQLKSNPLSLVLAANPLFSLPLASHECKWTVWLSKDDLMKRYWTLSQIAVLQGEEKEKTRQTFLKALEKPDVEVNEKGEIALHGSTYSFWTSKIPSEPQSME
ncbi:MAG: hypothetical protein M1821_000973 [Bathelium mastoideum]|nr:MAG: hypothetical protein M1821_000973 [Bathelium mastoideum]